MLRPALAALALLALALASGCGGEPRAVYPATGVVQEVDAASRQVVIAHEDIPDLMDAMTMSFTVADTALLDGVAPGDRVDFTLEFTGRTYRITELAPRGIAGVSSRGPRIADLVAERDPAPAFELTDQSGKPVALADLAGSAVVLDFVFTHCSGPCPLLTASRVELQRMLPEGLRAQTRFVSISLDPERDTPEALSRYAGAHGADLSDWSFLTGEPTAVDQVIRSYGVGTARGADGEIEHLTVTFLLDPEGRIARRYIGLDHDPDEIRRDLGAVLR